MFLGFKLLVKQKAPRDIADCKFFFYSFINIYL